jgi:hypothetical protein
MTSARRRLAQVVRDEHRGERPARAGARAHVGERGLQVGAGDRVEAPNGSSSSITPARAGERPRERHALPLPARELVREARGRTAPPAQPDQRQRVARARASGVGPVAEAARARAPRCARRVQCGSSPPSCGT